jgi:thioredoxin-like negative regulator of GroEL
MFDAIFLSVNLVIPKSMKYLSKEIYVLEGPASYQEISEEFFRKTVLKEGNPAIVTFSGDWMGSAAMLHLIVEDLCAEFKEKAHFYCINLQKSKLADELGIGYVATVCFFYKGEMLDQQIGLVAKTKLREKIEQFIKTI